MAKLIFGSGATAQEIPLFETGVTIGRNQAIVNIPIQDGSVSGNHASIRCEGGVWYLIDNNSSNGTFVNGKQIRSQALASGDSVTFGNVTLQFVDDAAPAQAPVQALAAAPAPAAEPANNGLKPGVKLPPKDTLKPGLKLPSQQGLKPGVKLPGKPAPAAAPKQEEAPKAAAPAPAPEPKKEEPKAEPKKEEPKVEPKKEEPKAEPKKEEPKFNIKPSSDWKPPVLNIDKNAPIEKMANDDIELIADLNDRYKRMKEELAQVVIGQASVVEEVLTAVFSRGHALLMGVPGLAKTLLISTISKVLALDYKRVQFTPDLMPSDITGTDVLEEDKASGGRHFRFVKGPVFTNMLLADEINRTPPKTQAALLEAMQEHHITVGSTTYQLPEPFFVLATQNPIEQEGTYPLPEAQMDRFMFNIIVHYPEADDETQIISNVTSGKKANLTKIMDGDMVLRIQDVVRRVPVAPHVIEYARNLTRATRPKQPEAPDFVRELIGWGAGPRAGISLIQAAKARAILHGRHHTTTGDVSAVALPVLRHRVITTFAAEAAGVTSDEVVQMLVKTLSPREDLEI